MTLIKASSGLDPNICTNVLLTKKSYISGDRADAVDHIAFLAIECFYPVFLATFFIGGETTFRAELEGAQFLQQVSTG